MVKRKRLRFIAQQFLGLPNEMSFSAINLPNSRAASTWAGFFPGAEPQYTQILTFLPCALGFSLEPEGVDVRDAGYAYGDAPPDAMLGLRFR
jgi:hypothetical protein